MTGKKGHKKLDCRNPDSWDDPQKKDEKPPANANLAEHTGGPPPSDKDDDYVYDYGSWHLFEFVGR